MEQEIRDAGLPFHHTARTRTAANQADPLPGSLLTSLIKKKSLLDDKID